MYRHLFFLFLLINSTAVFSQISPYASNLIDPALTENANAVVRDEVVEITVEAVDKMKIFTRKVLTILNTQGDSFAFAGDFYSDEMKIKDQSLLILDKNGAEIQKFKQKHFKDRSAVSSGTLYSDDRISYAEFTPQDYPYTMVYESEVISNNTIFVKGWDPLKGYLISTESSTYVLNNPANIELRYKERNLDGLHIEKSFPDNGLVYILKNLPAYKSEPFSPSMEEFNPELRVALKDFSLVGVNGSSTTWQDFGKWQYENLLQGRNKLPETTVNKITQLTSKAKTDVEKAKIIYDYVQKNSRYISVQLGIGGWEPVPAAEVDQLKYGDCKGLTNYTKALLDSQNILSHYAVVFAGEEKKNIDPDFTSMQGNHVILNLPQENGEDIWLECTSQTSPFNYLGDFTDDRFVLLVKPEGGEIVRTKNYSLEENIRETSTTIELNEDGNFEASVVQKSRGIPYGNIYVITTAKEDDQILFYKKNWGHLKNLNFQKPKFINDRENQEFTEVLKFTGDRYTSKAGNRLLLPLSFFIPSYYSLTGSSNRKLPLQISRGRHDVDVFEFVLPAGFKQEAIPEAVNIDGDFGSFKMEVQVIEKNGRDVLIVERDYVLRDGVWPAESVEDFRKFMNMINALGNQKAVLVKSL
ncbi:DUF3857 domain-containing protein [Salinimicrobium terrae]|uniref:DUF3857 domain-containing protein n=1 Tax=Salinimicrobium terrae TaxID=470866 RepID=UPI0003FC2392|nr:DUF3857 domain-containing protein [Salinimicrobium terrae]